MCADLVRLRARTGERVGDRRLEGISRQLAVRGKQVLDLSQHSWRQIPR